MPTNELRIRRVVSVLAGGSIVWIIGGFGVPFAIILIVRDGELSQAFLGYGVDAGAIAVAVMAALYVLSTFRRWWIQRYELHQLEHRLILGALVFLSSLVGGAANFAIYRIDDEAFALDEKAILRWIHTRNDAVEKRASQHQRDAELYGAVLAGVEASRQPSFKFRNQRRSRFHYPIQIPLNGVELAFIYSPPVRTVPGMWALEVSDSSSKREVRIDDLQQPGVGRLFVRPESDSVSKRHLVDILRFSMLWERNAALTLTASKRRAVPVAAFMYQSLMAVLGDNPRYFTPQTNMTRLLALVFGVARFLYIGIFVSLVVDGDRNEQGATRRPTRS